MIETPKPTETGMFKNNYSAYISIIITVTGSILLFLPFVSPILFIISLLMAFQARYSTQPNSHERNLANIALVISILAIVAYASIYLLLLHAHATLTLVHDGRGKL